MSTHSQQYARGASLAAAAMDVAWWGRDGEQNIASTAVSCASTSLLLGSRSERREALGGAVVRAREAAARGGAARLAGGRTAGRKAPAEGFAAISTNDRLRFATSAPCCSDVNRASSLDVLRLGASAAEW